jgi:gamma-glutamyltranspeptidase/glutathione hydrolase
MTPTIVLKGERPLMALGSRGGPTIPTTVLQVLLNVIVYRKSLVDAVAAPRYHQQGLPEDIVCERTRTPQKMTDALMAMGHGLQPRESIGDVHAIGFEGGKIVAVADPRRGGAAGGF